MSRGDYLSWFHLGKYLRKYTCFEIENAVAGNSRHTHRFLDLAIDKCAQPQTIEAGIGYCFGSRNCCVLAIYSLCQRQ